MLPWRLLAGNTPGMKAAVSIPDPVFRRADALAKRRRLSRSRLYADALLEYLQRHEADDLTEAMRRAHRAAGSEVALPKAAERTLSSIEWDP